MNNMLRTTDGFDSVRAMLRPHIKCSKGHWCADDDQIAEPEKFKCAVVMPSMEAGEIDWQDNKIASLTKQLVSKAGFPDGASEGFAPTLLSCC